MTTKLLLVAAALAIATAHPALARDRDPGRTQCKPATADGSARIAQTRRDAARIASQESCIVAHFRKQRA